MAVPERARPRSGARQDRDQAESALRVEMVDLPDGKWKIEIVDADAPATPSATVISVSRRAAETSRHASNESVERRVRSTGAAPTTRLERETDHEDR
jgi:hypothetical protein